MEGCASNFDSGRPQLVVVQTKGTMRALFVCLMMMIPGGADDLVFLNVAKIVKRSRLYVDGN
jgi:hypothetical protein